MNLVTQAANHAYHSRLADREARGDFVTQLMRTPQLCNATYWESVLKSAESVEKAQMVIDALQEVIQSDAMEIGMVARYVQTCIGIAKKTLTNEKTRLAIKARYAHVIHI
jgi:hypothetical protein